MEPHPLFFIFLFFWLQAQDSSKMPTMPAGKWNHGRHGCNFILGGWALCPGTDMEKKIQFLPLKPGCVRLCTPSWWRGWGSEHFISCWESVGVLSYSSIWELECWWRIVGDHLESGLTMIREISFSGEHINIDTKLLMELRENFHFSSGNRGPLFSMQKQITLFNNYIVFFAQHCLT